ncbi:MAG: hypothetical protein U0Q55_23560 [Vicinamibacterales bacterium]
MAQFLDALPNVLAAADLKAVARAIVDARTGGTGTVWALGAHVIKTGAPVLIDLMERGFVSAIATNGAAVIHDFEVALAGATSEDVDQALGPGSFGMADETGRLLGGAISDGVSKGFGLGQAVSATCAAREPRAQSWLRQDCTSIPCGPRGARHRHHPHASGSERRGARRRQPARLPLLRLQRGAPRARRVPELRLGRRAPRGIPQGGGARAQPGHFSRA